MARAARRERVIARTRDDILDAAAHAFAARGYRAATMHDIAKEAGYTAASLYTYFRSKAEIFHALFERMASEFLATYDEPIPAGLRLDQRLQMLLHQQLRVADQRRDWFLVMMGPGLPDAPGARRSGHPGKPMFEAHVRRLSAFLEGGGLEAHPGCDPEEAALLLIGITHAHLLRWLHGAPARKLQASTGRIVDQFLHGIAGCTAAPRR